MPDCKAVSGNGAAEDSVERGSEQGTDCKAGDDADKETGKDEKPTSIVMTEVKPALEYLFALPVPCDESCEIRGGLEV